MFNAKTTLDHLTQSNNGASRLKAMLGAKNFVRSDEEKWVSFRIPIKCKNKANYCKIYLTADDLYTVEFGYIRGMNYTVRSNVEGLYFDMLKEHFETETAQHVSMR